MVIISDTSPMTALLLAGRGELLTLIFDRVVIPPAVETELLCAHETLPVWLEVIVPKRIPSTVLEAGLDAGETEAIALALELKHKVSVPQLRSPPMPMKSVSTRKTPPQQRFLLEAQASPARR